MELAIEVSAFVVAESVIGVVVVVVVVVAVVVVVVLVRLGLGHDDGGEGYDVGRSRCEQRVLAEGSRDAKSSATATAAICCRDVQAESTVQLKIDT